MLIAISTSVEGETTLFYLMNRLRQFPGLKITSIARGIGFGDELEYVDELTITHALLNRREIDRLARETEQSGRTIVPLAIYFSDGYAKVEIAVATGKRDWDKRQTIAEREANREAQRAMSDHLKHRRR